ncbi:Rid family hydrolase [Halegenticoccus soli]|uniref:Rid family hydrolase n=1 Tax=Halegenticoccus soli TaxID=1985678 RepID=UPI000C6EE91F|nr:Rid family hydrolase [Halegenticoccus soli]
MRAFAPPGVIDATSIGYSHAVEVDDRLYLSGQVGWDAEFDVADGFAAQARRAFDNLETVLSEAGRERSDVAKVTAYLVDPAEHTEPFLETWRERFPEEPHPCLTIVGVAGLAREEFLLELDAEVAP